MELKESRKRHEKRRVVGTKVSRNDDLIVREGERDEKRKEGRTTKESK